MKTKTHKFGHFRILNMTKSTFECLKVVVFVLTSFSSRGCLTHLRASSWHEDLCRKSHSSSTPESVSWFSLSFSLLRWDGLVLRAAAKDAQLSGDRPQCRSLRQDETSSV